MYPGHNTVDHPIQERPSNMARFFHNSLRIPHIQNATERVRVMRFFLRGFSIGYLLLQSCVISIALLVRFKLGFPIQCRGFPEKVYAPTYTLVGMASAMWVVLVWGLVRIGSLRKSGHIKGVCVAYLALNVAQFFVILVSRLHSSGYSNRSLLQNYAHVFSNECLKRIQMKEKCCGFYNYTEWLEASRSGRPGKCLITKVESSDPEQIRPQLNHELYSNSVFPSSCWCARKASSNCLKVIYKSVNSNETGSLLTSHIKVNTSNLSSTEEPPWVDGTGTEVVKIANETSQTNPTTFISLDTNTVTTSATGTIPGSLTTEHPAKPRPQPDPELHATPTDHAHIYRKPCIDSLLEHFMTVDISAAATAVVSSSASLAFFIFGYFLIHNLEGTVTVSDIYRTPAATRQGDNSAQSRIKEENLPSSSSQPRDANSVAVLSLLASSNKTISEHDLSHFRVNILRPKHQEKPLDEKDIHASFPE
ncbi:hypothetical protein ElyMa_003245700 [Elysia marginata]|uniref:Tetraspanin n=1 Tax=Elysia marginata TaxID=1093978 RepID=A0AAV4JAR9_9GAST|nr:hypothetical protein ElyMa_003245700 [Elysia marginata]